MYHEHQQSHERSRSSTTGTVDHDADEPAPGQASRSAALRSPDHAITSGLVQPGGLGGGVAPATGKSATQAADRKQAAPPTDDAALETPEGCLRLGGPALVSLAGAYFYGTTKNAIAFIQTQPDETRAHLTEQLAILKKVWKASGKRQPHLKEVWKPFYLNHAPVTITQLTLGECESTIRELQKKRDFKSGHEPPRRWDNIRKSGGLCATVVYLHFKKMTGFSGGGHGYAWAGVMNEAIRTHEIPYRVENRPALTKLPNGSVLVWNKGGENFKYGHVCIVVDGHWVSDYISPPGKQAGGQTPNAVFVPLAPTP